MVISGCEQKCGCVGEQLRNKRHDERDRKLNATTAKSAVRHLGANFGNAGPQMKAVTFLYNRSQIVLMFKTLEGFC